MRCSACVLSNDFCPICDHAKEVATRQAVSMSDPALLFASRPNLLRDLAVSTQKGSRMDLERVFPLLSQLSLKMLLCMHADTVYELACSAFCSLKKNSHERSFKYASFDLDANKLCC